MDEVIKAKKAVKDKACVENYSLYANAIFSYIDKLSDEEERFQLCFSLWKSCIYPTVEAVRSNKAPSTAEATAFLLLTAQNFYAIHFDNSELDCSLKSFSADIHRYLNEFGELDMDCCIEMYSNLLLNKKASDKIKAKAACNLAALMQKKGLFIESLVFSMMAKRRGQQNMDVIMRLIKKCPAEYGDYFEIVEKLLQRVKYPLFLPVAWMTLQLILVH